MPPATPFDVEIHEMELCGVLKAQEEEDTGNGKKNVAEALMEGAQSEDEEDDEEDDEVEEKETKTQEGEAPAEEPKTDSDTVKEKSDMAQ